MEKKYDFILGHLLLGTKVLLGGYLIFLWEMERAHVILYFIGANQKIPH